MYSTYIQHPDPDPHSLLKLDPDPHPPKKLVPDPHKVNADPKHWYKYVDSTLWRLKTSLAFLNNGTLHFVIF
jgi:hypothetical protein